MCNMCVCVYMYVHCDMCDMCMWGGGVTPAYLLFPPVHSTWIRSTHVITPCFNVGNLNMDLHAYIESVLVH